jgi:hypothetical protein
MRARFARLALLAALLVVAAGEVGYLLSAPTDAAPAMRMPHVTWQQEQVSAEAQALMAGRERPTARPLRSDYEDASVRVRSSQLEALLQRNEGRSHD